MKRRLNIAWRKKQVPIFTQVILITLAIILITFSPVRAFAYVNAFDASEAVKFLPPMSSDTTTVDLDRSLLDFLEVTILQETSSGWVQIESLTSQNSGSERLRMEGNHYGVNWHPSVPPSGGEFQIKTFIAGLEVSSFGVTLSGDHKQKKDKSTIDDVILSTRGGVPIKFVVGNHPAIRARVLTEQGYPATEIGDVLLSEFGLSAGECAQSLFNEQHPAPSVGAALESVYGLGAVDTAALLKEIGYEAEGIGLALRGVFGLSAGESGQVMKEAGFAIDWIYSALKATYDYLTTTDAVQILKDIEYLAEEVVQFLKDGLGLLADEAAEILATVGYDAIQIAAGVAAVFLLVPLVVADILKNLGFPVDSIYFALIKAFDYLLWTDAVQILKDIGCLAEEVVQFLKSGLGLLADEAAEILATVGYDAIQIAAGVAAVFLLVPLVVADILKNLGFPVDSIYFALIKAFDYLLWTDAVQILKDIGCLAEDIVQFLKDGLGLWAEGAAEIMKAVGYGAIEIAAGVAAVFALVPMVVAGILKDLDFPIGPIYDALSATYTYLKTTDLVQILKDIGCHSEEIIQFLKDGLGMVAKEAAEILEAVGYGATKIAAGLAAGYFLVPMVVAGILKDLGFPVGPLYDALRATYTYLTTTSAVQILKDAEYLAGEIAQFLKDGLGWGANQAGTLLKAIGFSPNQIASALGNAYSYLTTTNIAQIMKDIGFGFSQIAQALANTFGLGGTFVATILHDIGAGWDALWSILSSIFSWSVADITAFLLSLFGL